MRTNVLSGLIGAWEARPRSAAELKEAAKHFERAAGLHPAPAGKAQLACWAEQCRSQAAATGFWKPSKKISSNKATS